MKKKVVVIGSGVGGLCTALYLLHAGMEVHVYEKNDKVGGVIAPSYLSGNTFEQSATMMIEPEQYRRFFKGIGKDMNDYLEVSEKEVLYTIIEPNKALWKLERRIESDAFEKQIEYRNLVTNYQKKYSFLNKQLLTKPVDDICTVLALMRKKETWSMLSKNTCKKVISDVVSDESLQKATLFQTLYMGLPAQLLPAIFTSVPALSHAQGIPHIKGGMSAFLDALMAIFREFGGILHLHAPVERILAHSNRVCGVVVGNKPVFSDIVISNADYCYTMDKLLPYEYGKRRNYTHSVSVYILRLVLKKKAPCVLTEHNMYLGENFEEEMNRLAEGKFPQTPPIYIYYPDSGKTEQESQVSTCIQMVVRVPNLQNAKFSWTTEKKERMQEICYLALAEIGFTKDDVINAEEMIPEEFLNKYNRSNGASFGIAHTLMQSGVFRPQSKHPDVKDMYFVGSNIHPGNGVSMVMKGAAITAKEIVKACLEQEKI